MARLRSHRLSWIAVLDAASYLVYVLPSESSNSVDQTVETGEFYEHPSAEVPATIGEDGRVSVDLATLSVTPEVEGIYDIYVTAVDEAGNESDPALLDDAALDFTPPEAPTDLRLG